MVDLLLLVEGTSAVGKGTMSRQCVAQLHVQAVGQVDGNTLPDQYHYDDAGCLTLVTWAFTHQH